jgi:hypothetical protein
VASAFDDAMPELILLTITPGPGPPFFAKSDSMLGTAAYLDDPLQTVKKSRNGLNSNLATKSEYSSTGLFES